MTDETELLERPAPGAQPQASTPVFSSDQGEEDLFLPLDAFVRSVWINRTTQYQFFLGAGASMSSGVPSAQKCIWEWKRSIFLTRNPGLETQFSELSLACVQQKIQAWLAKQSSYPADGSSDEYGFYIKACFPIESDRRAYFQHKVRDAQPHVGYRLLCHLAQAGMVRSVWTTNFDGLAARAAASFRLTPIEVGIDSQSRLPRTAARGELLCVSLHGDYRYDKLKNTPEELQKQEAELEAALIDQLADTPLIVCGYSGRDQSVMEALGAAYAREGTAPLYWCGFSDGKIPDHIAALIRQARKHGRQAFYVPTQGFDDLLTRLALHCLDGESREEARKTISDLAPPGLLDREPFHVPRFPASKIIKSNAFELDLPSEVLEFELNQWPEERVWSWVRETVADRPVAAVPFKGKILALGTIDDIKQAFGDNVKGGIERTPVAPSDLYYDGAVVSLMRQALVRSMADTADVESDGQEELWRRSPLKKVLHDGTTYCAHESVQVHLRRIGRTEYLILMPSIKVLAPGGADAPNEAVKIIKQGILSGQYNKPFNQTVNNWRKDFFPGESPITFEYPLNCGSSFKFRVRKAPIFAEIGLPNGGKSVKLPEKQRPLLVHRGLELGEPKLLFSDKRGTGYTSDTHPIRGIVENRPFDFALTQRGFVPSVRVGVICPAAESRTLHTYLHKVNEAHSPTRNEGDYLIDYPGFQTAYSLPIELPDPGSAGWFTCPEPANGHAQNRSLEVAQQINSGIEALRSSYAPHVVLIFFPDRWNDLRGYRTDDERFDVHDFVKAFCVQRGVATQFLNQDTLIDAYQCRVWWWLSLALYVKSMRTPWVLDGLPDDAAFVGLGFSIDRTAERGRHVVLGCSHIYSARGEGLQYRLSRVEDPILRGGNPFMSREDARRTGETIRELFYAARDSLPRRVVLHKRTPFLRDEREGLLDGLSGVECIDMLEIQIDHSLRYVASEQGRDGKIDEDNYPVRRGTALQLDDYSALLWVHGATSALNPRLKYFQGKRRIPAPLTVKRHAGKTELKQIAEEILGLSKMNWNTFDLYTKFPATLQSSGEIARIGSLLKRFSGATYDYRLFI